MAIPHISCPYCDAILTEMEPRADARRVLCPQCGETFPLPKGMNIRDGIVSPDSHRTDADKREPSAGPKLSNRTIALSLLALMGLMAIIFLGFALQTQDIRRQHDTSLPKSQSITIPIGVAAACNVYVVALIFAIVRPRNRPGPMRLTILLAGITVVVFTAGLLRVHIRLSSDPNAAEEILAPPVLRHLRPIELSALCYMPADTNLIVGVHVAELMETPSGQEVLAGNGPARFWNWQQLQSWTGLDLHDMRYMVAGLKVDNNLLPRLVLVVETIRPFEVAKIQASLKAGKWPDPEAVRFLSDHMLVLSLNRKDLQSIPSKVTGNADHLSPPLRSALKQRIALGAQVWVAGHAENWDKTLAAAYLASMPQKNHEILNKIQTIAVGVRVDEQPIVQAAFQCFDEPAAKAFLAFLLQQDPDQLKDWKINQKETWISFQANPSDLSFLVNKIKISN